MVALGRIAADHRPWLVVLAVLAVLGIGGLLLGVYPLRARVAAIDQQSLRAQNELRVARQQELSARQLVAGKDQAARDLERFYTEVLPADQAEARRLTYKEVADLAEGADLDVDRRSIAVSRPEDSRLTRMSTRIVLRGTYAQVRRFLHDLESSTQFVVISGIQLARRTDDEAMLQLELELATYFCTRDGS
jgi:Tfp pilus assembly protein PilO